MATSSNNSHNYNKLLEAFKIDLPSKRNTSLAKDDTNTHSKTYAQIPTSPLLKKSVSMIDDAKIGTNGASSTYGGGMHHNLNSSLELIPTPDPLEDLKLQKSTSNVYPSPITTPNNN